jgi:hypothetical protein
MDDSSIRDSVNKEGWGISNVAEGFLVVGKALSVLYHIFFHN